MTDAHRNFAYSTVAVPPSPAASGTALTVQAGAGANFPTAPFNATVWQGPIPLASNAEVVRVTAIAGDVLTIARAQEGTSARTILIGDQVAASITAKVLSDIEAALMPPGAILEFGGFVPPSSEWLMADGAPQSRATYSRLFDAITDRQTGTLTSGGASVTGLADTGRLATGMAVEGTGVTAGTTIASITSASALTLSGNATASGAQQLRFIAHGVGDGSTTFNTPDRRGRQAVGRGTHSDNVRLGATDGLAVDSRSQKHAHSNTLGLPNHGHTHSLTLPNHGHSHTLTLPNHGHSHSLTLPNHAHSNTQQAGGQPPGGGNNYLARTSQFADYGPILDTGNPTTLPSIGGSVGNPSSLPSIDGSVGNPSSLPSIAGSVGNPASLPAITGAVGVGAGVSDTAAFIVVNYLVKT